MLASLPAEERARLLDNRLRQVVSVGEPLTGDLVHTWRQGFGHPARVVNILGQTETTGMFTAYVVPPTTTPEEGVIPVGQPVRDVVLEVRGETGQPVADGEVGELYISTPSLAQGYWNQPDLTAQRFLCPPDRTTTCGRVYRTGDLARCRADGNLEYLGRVDQQVKVRGKRVDLVEVEAYLRQVPGVTDAVVASRLTAQEETILVAVVTAVPGAQLTLQGIWAHLRRALPEHALPATVYTADLLPYLPNGKLDRRSAFSASNLYAVLPVGMPSDIRHVADGCNRHAILPGYAEPCTEEQAACAPCPSGVDVSLTALLLDTMAAVLKLPSVAPYDDFFALGGHSLQAAILAMRVGQATGRRIPVELIYAAPTATRLAAALGALAGDTDEGATLVPLRPEGECPPFFLVHGLGGGVVGYADLVRHLPPGWPVYGLRASGTEGESAPDETIEAMAARYLTAVRTLQPSGPYRLGGYCYGGVVAFEMARPLATEGEPPALVAIIEGFAPGWKHGRSPLLHPDRLRLVAGNIPFWWEEYRTLGGDVLRRRLAKKLHLTRPVAGTRGGQCVTLAQEIVDDDLSVLPTFRQRLLDIHLHAIRHYAPAPYPGVVTLFRARGRTVSQVLMGPLDDDLGWHHVAASVDLHTVPGAHRNLHLMPYAPSLAAALASVLDRPVG
jgi:aspartate racemase